MHNESALPPNRPNPLAPLEFLSEDVVKQTTMFFYASVGSVSVLIWDLLNHLSGDFKILTERKLNLSTLVYFISRWSTLACMTTNLVMYTAPIGSCGRYAVQQSWLYPFSTSTTALLFIFRVHAVFNRNRYVSAAFLLAWLGVIAGALTIPLGIHVTNIGTTSYCFADTSSIPTYWSASGIFLLIFDSAVYVAISLRLMWVFEIKRPNRRVRGYLSGRGLPRFSRGLFQDGQVYYFYTASMHLLAVILFNITSLPLSYRLILGPPSQVLTNIMACRVYRNARLGIISKGASPTSKDIPSQIQFVGDGASASDIELGEAGAETVGRSTLPHA